MEEAGQEASAYYGFFSVAAETDNYRLTVDSYDSNSSAGDSLLHHNGSAFSTVDRDNDNNPGGNCAIISKAAFWHNNCLLTNPLGKYGDNSVKGIVYQAFQGLSTSLDSISFRIRQKRCDIN